MTKRDGWRVLQDIEKLPKHKDLMSRIEAILGHADTVVNEEVVLVSDFVFQTPSEIHQRLTKLTKALHKASYELIPSFTSNGEMYLVMQRRGSTRHPTGVVIGSIAEMDAESAREDENARTLVYVRVLPRDLFNEGNLLKCYGRLWIELEKLNGNAVIEEPFVDRFEIEQDSSSGSLTVANLTFRIGDTRYRLERPLNARSEWPLIVAGCDSDPDFEEIPVFADDGNLSPELQALILKSGSKP